MAIVTEKQIKKMHEMLAQGKSIRSIAKELGVARTTFQKYYAMNVTSITSTPKVEKSRKTHTRLSVKDIRAIRTLVAYYSSPEYSFLKVNCSALATQYNVTPATMHNIIRGKSYKGV
jgi:IS30 family transposase